MCALNRQAPAGGGPDLGSPPYGLDLKGAKRVFLGTEVFDYDAARMLVYALDIPVSAVVTRASLDEPYFGIRIDLDPGRIADLVTREYRRHFGNPPSKDIALLRQQAAVPGSA